MSLNESFELGRRAQDLVSMKASETIAFSERERELGGLTSHETRLLFRIFEKLSAPSDLHVFRQEVSEDLLCLLESDVFASYVWNLDTQTFGDFAGFGQDPLNVEEYLSYFQFRDPITCLLQRRTTATLVSEVMPQPQLERTEYFNDFLMRDSQHHGMDLHAYKDDVELGDLRIWRTKNRPDFGRREIALLNIILPHFRNALLNARMMCAAQGIEAFWTHLLDNIDVGLFLFDEMGRLLYLNNGAREIEKRLHPDGYSSFCDYICSGIRDNRLSTGWGPFSLSMLKMLSPQNSRPVVAVLVHPSASKPVTPELLRAEVQSHLSGDGNFRTGV